MKADRPPSDGAPGRRSKLTPEVQQRIVSALRAGNYLHVAAEYAGIGKSTLYRWIQRGNVESHGAYRDFRDAVRTAEREAEVRAVAIVQKHMNNNWQAAMTFLERKYPHRWGRKDRVTVDVDPGEALATLLALAPEDIEATIDQAALLGDGDASTTD